MPLPFPIASPLLALRRVSPAYPADAAAPYDPGESFPEFENAGFSPAGAENPIFSAVRGLLCDLGLDAARFGTPEWNPLGDFVGPGRRILVKPNWVLHRNQNAAGGMDCMITHPSVLRAVLEYAFLTHPAAVTLADAPLQGCDFGQLRQAEGLETVIAGFRARGLPLTVTDLRRTVLDPDGSEGARKVRENLRDDSHYVLADLGARSFLEPVSQHSSRFRVTMYDPRMLQAHHRPGVHQYLLAREAMEADLVINCPKLKTHKKAGITCCLKNLIGINGNKEYLPHHRKGAAEGGRGGDSHLRQSALVDLLESALDFINKHRDMPRFYDFAEKWIYRVENRIVRRRDPDAQMEGNWSGNDTIWRTCLDLNVALLYATADARLHDRPVRQELSIVDAVVAGQGDGPLAPTPLETGALFAAHNPALGDLLAARLLGFDPDAIPLLRHATDETPMPVLSMDRTTALARVREVMRGAGGDPFPHAVPPPNWKL